MECNFQYQQRNLSHLQKREDRFNEGYNSYGEPGPLCDVENIEDNKDFDEEVLPAIAPLVSGENNSDVQGNSYVLEGFKKSNSY